ncbi:tRNA (mnm(5)s(2)U34)-methyltransferase [Clostridium oceanicum]|uniref:Class I SAM-dependent methyltransferase n=1 Tax=Clostridium oceanicum TaxID=1543 RepID=A0ABN1JQU8_9CLOT
MLDECFNNGVSIARKICATKLSEGSIAVDCTMGKGNDTLYLSNLVGKEGEVFAFDVQEKAVDKTYKKLKENNMLDRVNLIKDGHENIDKYIKNKVDLFMFNLGYLPGSDHDITTKPETTLKSLKKCIDLLKDKGIIIMVVYYGHENGKKEKIVLEKFVENLNQKEYNVFKTCFVNQVNNPPFVICIEKR